MTEKEFVYAAFCNFGAIGQKKATKYCEANPKDKYTSDDWIAVFYSDPEPIKTGSKRPLVSHMIGNGTHCYTTKQWISKE